MDHNYVKKDSGERHVFEIMCANGDRRQLHFHKSGRMEDPTLLFNSTTPPPPINTGSSAAQPVEHIPAWTFEECMRRAGDDSLHLGRNEVQMALHSLFFHYGRRPDMWPCAVDITDPDTFTWPRWLRNVTESREIVMSAIAKVHIRREEPETPIALVSCRADDTYAEVTPIKGTPIVQGAGWRARREITHAAIASQSWMRARRTLNDAHEM